VRSRRKRALLAVLGVVLPGALGCEAILGLDGYQKVDGGNDAGTDGVGYVDAPQDAVDETPLYNPDASVASRWARWIMPNAPVPADGGTDVDAGPTVQNQAVYAIVKVAIGDGGADAQVEVVEDLTAVQDAAPQHFWLRSVVEKDSIAEAEAYCASLGFRLPTRIELVSILDAARSTPPLVDPVFTDAGVGSFWTSSPMPSKTEIWTVDFASGAIGAGSLSGRKFVRCIR
jgi:hypothetical protein